MLYNTSGDFLFPTHQLLVKQEPKSNPVYQEQLAAILANAVDAIISINERGIMVAVNPGTENMFGFSKSELVGNNINMLMPAPYHDNHDEYLARYLASGIRKIIGIGREVIGRRKDGSMFPIHLAVSEIHLDNERLFTGIIRDISDVKAVEKKLVQNERLAAIGQMMAGLAHESRNALQKSHACLTNLAFDVREQPESLDLVHKVQNSLDHLNSLLDEVRDYAAPIIIKKSQVNLESLICETWQQISIAHAESVKQADISFSLQSADHFPESVQIDRVRLGQVIWNLLENARTACDSEHGKIRVDLKYNRDAEDSFQFIISDNGLGIPNSDIHLIFEPFFTTKTKGTGLGLAICKRIVDAHSGTIALINNELGGASFVCELPMEHDIANSLKD
jgi:two-component system, LuxR family, sensor kinase FixL